MSTSLFFASAFSPLPRDQVSPRSMGGGWPYPQAKGSAVGIGESKNNAL